MKLKPIEASSTQLNNRYLRLSFWCRHLTAQLVAARTLLYRTGRLWREHNILDSELLEFMNLTLPCGRNCPLSTAKPKRCLIDKRRETIRFEFEVNQVDHNVKILRADPFVQMSFSADRTAVCYHKYIGPKIIIIKEDTNCMMSLPDSAFSLQGFMVDPGSEHCLENDGTEGTPKYWHEDRCLLVSHMHSTERIQVKYTDTENYIYCPRRDIKVHELETPCPDFVFPLPRSVSFSIGKFIYLATRSRIDTTNTVDREWIHKLNFHINPPLPTVNTDFNETEKLISELTLNSSPSSISNEVSSHFLLMAWTFVIITVAVLLWLCQLNKGRSYRPTRTVELELKEQAAQQPLIMVPVQTQSKDATMKLTEIQV
ncbi:hypothetical protein HDE_12639 [Halotydeus destructor]|nr:hypothetical protein HDE_12639 [Halotydeus destructor]